MKEETVEGDIRVILDDQGKASEINITRKNARSFQPKKVK